LDVESPETVELDLLPQSWYKSMDHMATKKVSINKFEHIKQFIAILTRTRSSNEGYHHDYNHDTTIQNLIDCCLCSTDTLIMKPYPSRMCFNVSNTDTSWTHLGHTWDTSQMCSQSYIISFNWRHFPWYLLEHISRRTHCSHY